MKKTLAIKPTLLFRLLFAIMTVCATRVWAQSTLPPSAEPSTLQRDFIERQQPSPVKSPLQLPPTQGVIAPPGADRLTLTLQSVVLSGNRVFSTEELAPLYNNLIGQTITLADVYAIAQRITQKYEEAGYIFSTAIMPAQEVTNGIVKIEVIEAYVADLNITGEKDFDADFMRKFTRKAKTFNPLHKKDLEKLLSLLNNLPGVTITPVLIPSTAPGAIMLEVILGITPYQANALFNNRGSKYTGPFRQTASAILNNLPHLSSLKVTEETAFPVDELQVAALNYTLPLDADGNRLELSATLSHAQPGDTLSNLDVESESETFRLGWQTPLWFTPQSNGEFSLAFEHIDSTSYVLGGLNAKDHLRVLEAAIQGSHQHNNGGHTAARLALRQGLDILNASSKGDSNLSRANGRGQFTSLKLDFQHVQPLDSSWALISTLTGQYAGNQLLAAEEFAWGGSRFGRAYDTAEFTGDHGLGAGLELDYTLPTASSIQHQFYGFADLGAAWKIDDNQPQSRASGLTAGLGWRAQVTDHFSTSLEVAKPLTRGTNNRSLNKDHPRLFIGLHWYY